MLTERQIQCTTCGMDFAFTVEEQEFYIQKGFQDPKKCKPCRAAAKSQRQGGGGGYGGGGYGGRQERQLFDVQCAACGQQTQVPFRPKGDRPVYCRSCYADTVPSRY